MKILISALHSPESFDKLEPVVAAAAEIFDEVDLLINEPLEKNLSSKIQIRIAALNDKAAYLNAVQSSGADVFYSCNGRLAPRLAMACEGLSNAPYSRQAAETMAHKDRWYAYLKDNGFPFVKFFVPPSFSQLAGCPFDQPLVIKPTFSSGSLNTFRAKNIADLKQALSEGRWYCGFTNTTITAESFDRVQSEGAIFGRWLVMPFLKGPQYGCEMVFHKGKPRVIFSEEIHVTDDGISPWAHRRDDSVPGLRETALKVFSSLDISYANITPDFIWDGESFICIDPNLNLGGEGILKLLKAMELDYARESLRLFADLSADFSMKGDPVAMIGLPCFRETREKKIINLTRGEYPHLVASRPDVFSQRMS